MYTIHLHTYFTYILLPICIHIYYTYILYIYTFQTDQALRGTVTSPELVPHSGCCCRLTSALPRLLGTWSINVPLKWYNRMNPFLIFALGNVQGNTVLENSFCTPISGKKGPVELSNGLHCAMTNHWNQHIIQKITLKHS